MKLFIKIVGLLIIVCPCTLLGQTYFNMRYPPDSGSWGGWAASIVSTDSAYYLNRSSRNFVDGNRKFSFTKLGLTGEVQEILDTLHFSNWGITVAGVKAIRQGFIEATSLYKSDPVIQQYGVVKYDSLGNILFHHIDTHAYPYIYIAEIIELVDQSFILVGTVIETVIKHTNQKTVLIKTDSLGNEIWKRTYKFNTKGHLGESIAQCDDGGFIIGGSEKDYTTRDTFIKPLVIKTDSLGSVQWKKTYGSTSFSNEPANGIIQTHDGGFAFVGALGVNHDLNIDQHIPWVVKLNANGIKTWEHIRESEITGSGISENHLSDIIELKDSSLVVGGTQTVYYPNKPTMAKHRGRGVIAKYTPSGMQLWTRYHFHPEAMDEPLTINHLYDIEPTPDGGFAATGFIAHSIDNSQDTWVIKVDSFGCVVQGCEVNSVPQVNAPMAALKIYPNPATEILNIEITPNSGSQQRFELELYDILGKRVLHSDLFMGTNTVNISHLPTGMYTYKIGEVWGQVVVR